MSDAAERLTTAVRDHGSDVLAYLQRRVRPVEDAADLLSEVFVIAWRRVEELPAPDVALRMWLFVTARNVLANHRRRQLRAGDLTAALRAHLVVHQRDTVRSGTSAPERGDVSERVEQALEALPPVQRELVRLVHWEGFTIAEAAVMTDTTASTARSRYAAARAALAARLSPAPPGTPRGEDDDGETITTGQRFVPVP